MTPLSVKPAKRAFHAVWMIGGLDGFKMVIHGGQSDEGSGDNSVVGDTWRLDLSTNVWTKYSSDPNSPPVFHSFASRCVWRLRAVDCFATLARCGIDVRVMRG
eukprot:3777626-Rhodomonas_salina.1